MSNKQIKESINVGNYISNVKVISIAVIILIYPLINILVSQWENWQTIISARKAFVESHVSSKYIASNFEIDSILGEEVFTDFGTIRIESAQDNGKNINVKLVVFPNHWLLDEDRVPIWSIHRDFTKEHLKSTLNSSGRSYTLSEVATGMSIKPWEFNTDLEVFREINWKVYQLMRSSTVTISNTPVIFHWKLAGYAISILSLILLVIIRNRLIVIINSNQIIDEPWIILQANIWFEKVVSWVWVVLFTFSPFIATVCLFGLEIIYSIAFLGTGINISIWIILSYSILSPVIILFSTNTIKKIVQIRNQQMKLIKAIED
ncbi:hypothetical protein [Carboxylicivirga sp. RSCT41]|uniref:hypothetical protein n=1 Tax=Carboxylicivirga agarovorans TaxID=3417570 RepID=UPI003D32D0F6